MTGSHNSALRKRVANMLGWFSGKVLVLTGRAYIWAGDRHEAAHILAALRAGDSDTCNHDR
jgi:hypothetical protein